MEVIGLLLLLLVGIPIIGLALTVALGAFALQVAIVGAIIGYLIGIPWAIWFRVANGRWPQR